LSKLILKSDTVPARQHYEYKRESPSTGMLVIFTCFLSLAFLNTCFQVVNLGTYYRTAVSERAQLELQSERDPVPGQVHHISIAAESDRQ